MNHPTCKYQNVWTPEEIAVLYRWAAKKSGREIALLAGHTRAATLRKMALLGLRGMPSGRQPRWTAVQMEALRRVPIDRPQMTCRAFAVEQGMTVETVRHWARKIGFQFYSGFFWDAQDVERLRSLAPEKTLRELAAELGRSPRAVRSKLAALGLKCAHQPRPRREPAATPQPVRVRVVRLPKEKTASIAAPRRIRPRRIEVSRIEYCPRCHAPVSNWGEHFERMGHRRTVAA